jgi:UDP-4-amino-4,6-dideoxy-N-acetyl-beta-L-altrosamine N-acetyltransferase
MIRFVKLGKEHLGLVMGWRVKPEVTRYMATNVEFDLKEQKRWYSRIAKNSSYRYWVIYFQETPVGLINLAGIDSIHRHCTAGYYIADLQYRQVGALVPPYLYNHVFRDLKFHKIYGEVMAENKRVLQMHTLHGFRQVGTYRDHYFKEGRFHDVVLIELLAESWLKKKAFHRYRAAFL